MQNVREACFYIRATTKSKFMLTTRPVLQTRGLELVNTHSGAPPPPSPTKQAWDRGKVLLHPYHNYIRTTHLLKSDWQNLLLTYSQYQLLLAPKIWHSTTKKSKGFQHRDQLVNVSRHLPRRISNVYQNTGRASNMI